MTPIEIVATIFAVLILVKLFLIVVSPKTRVKIAEMILSKNPAILTMILLILTAIIGYYIFNRFTMVDVAAIMMFLSGLMALFFIQYPKISIELARESLKSRDVFLRKNWLSILIWLAIAILVLYTILA